MCPDKKNNITVSLSRFKTLDNLKRWNEFIFIGYNMV